MFWQQFSENYLLISLNLIVILIISDNYVCFSMNLGSRTQINQIHALKPEYNPFYWMCHLTISVSQAMHRLFLHRDS